MGKRAVRCMSLLGRSSRHRECLLENNDLARMVQVVLRRATELSVRRVLGAQLLRKALAGEGADGALELLIQLVQEVLALAPGLRTKLRHWRPLFLRRELRTFSTNTPKNQDITAGQVKDDLPNAVSAGYRMGGGVFRRNTRQHLAHGGPMPGLAPKGSTDLICEDLHIQRHRLSHSTRSAEPMILLNSTVEVTAALSLLARTINPPPGFFLRESLRRFPLPECHFRPVKARPTA